MARAGRRQFVQSYPSEETKIYQSYFKKYAEEEIIKQKWSVPEKGKAIYIEMVLYLDRKRKDPNNFLKLPIDVLTDAGVWIDDDVVLPLCKNMYIDAINPRIEIKIYPSNSIGIFENEREFENFKENNCNICKKDSTRCSVLKRLTENRIIEESDNKNCLKIKKIT
ncbi:RusA family crossover junction endodeoxyribonuclease [Staphylococcus equorum]|uniref:RusA family crossover junction endodeoxyribonuclease n=1 Tax=Staphylococcus equorum TaxID=246432 RepID=A0A9X4R5A6_9STAP|nr:RusA family crossover junction endodeoxyribonuclease [Staphylococcus equorum]MDG0860353.1 RusA family crossover junction endodeoxyribonuclease [Staphylococcus equorum]